MVRSVLSLNFDSKEALKTGDAAQRISSWTWKTVLLAPAKSVTVLTSPNLDALLGIPVRARKIMVWTYLRLVGIVVVILGRCQLVMGIPEKRTDQDMVF